LAAHADPPDPGATDADTADRRAGAAADHQAYAADKQVIVAVRDVQRHYQVGDEMVKALDGISLDIFAGEYLSIMGPSGSGKSTLFNMIGGLDTPTRGEVVVHGVKLAELSRREQARLRNRCVGYIFQTYNLIPVMTAQQNVSLPMLLGGMEAAQANRKAAELLAAVGLGDRMHHRPDELSGGQQQRTAIARSFANDPAIILADEPTGNLDTRTGESIIEMLSQMSRQRGVTIITATHDHKMLSVSDRVVTIRDGRIDRVELRSQLNIRVGTIATHDQADGRPGAAGGAA
jgi:putative ABC transport system ATP-binding protein